jgi:signal transduction histidine kinase
MPLMTGVTGLFLAWAFFRSNTLHISPIAYDRILSSVKDGVLVINQQGIIIEANSVAVQLLMMGELIRLPFEGLRLPYKLVVMTEELHTFDFVREQRFIEGESFPLRANGKIMGRTVILRDQTAHKQAEREALALAFERERSRLLQYFLEQISQGFTTPLTIIQDAFTSLKSAEGAQSAHYEAQIEAQIEIMTRDMQQLRKLLDPQVHHDNGLAMENYPKDGVQPRNHV